MKFRVCAFQIFVSNVEKAKQWYQEKLGFGVIEELPEYKFVLMEFDGIEFDLIEPNPSLGEEWEKLKEEIGKFTGIVFETDDIENVVKNLEKRGVKFVELPEEKAWGEIRARFMDLDGNVFEILQVKK